jgi:hypothetical protein
MDRALARRSRTVTILPLRYEHDASVQRWRFFGAVWSSWFRKTLKLQHSFWVCFDAESSTRAQRLPRVRTTAHARAGAQASRSRRDTLQRNANVGRAYTLLCNASEERPVSNAILYLGVIISRSNKDPSARLR